MGYRHWIGVGVGIILGLILVAAGLGKLLYQFESFPILSFAFPHLLSPVFTKIIFTLLSYVELIVGLLLIIGIAAKLMAAFSLALIAGFITYNGWMLSHGLGDEPCGCLGIVETIARVKFLVINALCFDVGMLGLALLVLFCYQSSFFNIYPWFLRRGKIAE